jgi:3-mercaptopyruvate sulfurtransferase SseA
MMPSNQLFADIVGQQMGISHTDTIIVYDGKGLMSAPRMS